MFEPVDASLKEAVKKVFNSKASYKNGNISIFEMVKFFQNMKNEEQPSEIYQDLDATKVYSGIETVNSIFKVSISYDCITIYYGQGPVISHFKMWIVFEAEKIYYKYKCKVYEISELLEEREEEFINKLFLRVSDCPKWIQEKLLKMKKTIKKERRRRLLRKFLNC